jgi:hypothetical protein
MYRSVKIVSVLLLLIVLTSCKDFWSGSTQRQFKEACTEQEIKSGNTKEKADAYCDCVLKKMMKKYPNEEDAFGHLGDLAKDSDLINCRNEVGK